MKAFLLISAVAITLSGCAIAPQSSDEVVQILTQDDSGPVDAACYLKNERGSWVLFHAPGYIDILRGTNHLDVTCKANYGKHGHVLIADNGNGDAAAIGKDPGGVGQDADSNMGDVPTTGNPIDQYHGMFSAYPSDIIVPMTGPNTLPPVTVGVLPPPPAPVVIHYKHRKHHYVPACTPSVAPAVK